VYPSSPAAWRSCRRGGASGTCQPKALLRPDPRPCRGTCPQAVHYGTRSGDPGRAGYASVATLDDHGVAVQRRALPVPPDPVGVLPTLAGGGGGAGLAPRRCAALAASPDRSPRRLDHAVLHRPDAVGRADGCTQSERKHPLGWWPTGRAVRLEPPWRGCPQAAFPAGAP